MTSHDRRASSVPKWPWLVLGVVAAASAYGMVAAARDADTIMIALNQIAFAGLPTLFAALGALIEIRQPGNRIGRLLMVIGAGLVISGLIDIAVNALEGPPDRLTPQMFLLLWGQNVAWITFLFPLVLFLYIFPTGHLPSRRWRWAPWLLVGMTSFLVSLFVVTTEIGPQDGSWTLVNPLGLVGPDAVDATIGPWVVALLVVVAGAATAMVIRYRRSLSLERAQIKLVLVSVVFFAVSYAVLLLSEGFTDASSPVASLLPIGLGGIPVAITMAVLKHGLFGVDVVISRSLTYGTLLVVIGGVYVAIVVGVGSLFGQGRNVSFGLSVVATAVVAVAFQSMRRRVEYFANRLVYGKRATPYEVLARFSRRAADTSGTDLLERLPRMIVDGTGASEATVWVRTVGGFRSASSWPDPALTRTINGNGSFSDPDADYSIPAVHNGEHLGGISIVKPRTESMTPAETTLLDNLAEGMGLALRNSQLTEQLRRQVKDLRRSRDRIVTAAYEARRALEQDLDSGPQQQLVAVKVKLGPARVMAQRANAVNTAKILTDIETQAGDAIQAVRDFAGGIYPPLLEAEGLPVALTNQTRDAAIPITIHTDNIGRYPRDVEAAIYFSILEALQNTAKYANATNTNVTLTDREGTLQFQVTDNGNGFDPDQTTNGIGLNSITDRIDNVGGTTHIQSAPGTGTTITGTVPIRDKVPA